MVIFSVLKLTQSSSAQVLSLCAQVVSKVSNSWRQRKPTVQGWGHLIGRRCAERLRCRWDPFIATVEVVSRRQTLNLRTVLAPIIEISYCFYYLATKMDIILAGFNTPTSAAFAIHLAKYKTRPELKLKSSASYLLPTGKQICVENRKIKRRARIA